MKKLLFFVPAMIMILTVSLSGQNIEQPPVSKHVVDQSVLYNEVSASYGLGSLYIFTGTNTYYPTYYDGYSSYYDGSDSDIKSAGSFAIGYSRMVHRVVAIGFSCSYQNLNYDNKYTYYGYYPNDTTYSITTHTNDNIYSGIAKITFNYVNKPMVRVYSSFGFGVAVILSNQVGDKPGDVKQTDKTILPAGQLTFMGVRFGRNIGGFFEFGIGTNYIVSGGLSYQFGD
jgi:hypothetical protein